MLHDKLIQLMYIYMAHLDCRSISLCFKNDSIPETETMQELLFTKT